MLILRLLGPVFVLLAFPSSLWALSGSIIDPALSSIQKESDQAIERSFKLKFARNLRRSGKGFLNINQQNNIFDTLSVSADLTVRVSLKWFSYFENHSFSHNKSLLTVLSYGSPVIYNNLKIKRDRCWQSVFCIKNLSFGILSPLFKRGDFHGTYMLYFNLPVSKLRVQKQSFLLGLGGSLNTKYKLFSDKGFQLSALSSHFFDMDGYRYKKEKVHGDYNEPLSMAHQLGLQFYYALSPLVPLIDIHSWESWLLASFFRSVPTTD